MRHAVAAALLLSAGAATATDCQVVSVHDGDTLTAQCADQRLKVRLAEIDAPERGQPYSRRSTDHLKAICLGKSATLRGDHLDKYRRTLARVTCAGVDANAEQVRSGYAWAFTQYLTDPDIATLETAAKDARRGLWRAQNPIPPWEFRHPR